jgi:hypothetical protein
MASVVRVSLGDEVEAPQNRPEGSKIHNRILIHMSDGRVLKKGTGWWVGTTKEAGKEIWWHLGGDRTRPLLYKLDDSLIGMWTKKCDQTLAYPL